MEDHLHGPFWLPFVEPRFLLHGGECDPDDVPRFDREDREENIRLARLWDSRGLLRTFRGIFQGSSTVTKTESVTGRLETADWSMVESIMSADHQSSFLLEASYVASAPSLLHKD